MGFLAFHTHIAELTSSTENNMQDTSKRVVIGSMAVAGLVAVAAIADLVVGIPFSGSPHTKVMDVIFILCSGIVIYLGWTVFRDLS